MQTFIPIRSLVLRLFSLLFLVSAAAAHAQDTIPVPPDSRVRVLLASTEIWLSGQLVAADADSITLVRCGGCSAERFAVAEIAALDLRTGPGFHDSIRSGAIAGVVAAGVALAITAPCAGDGCVAFGFMYGPIAAAVGALGGAMVFAAIWVVTPRSWKRVYTAGR